jgi:CRP-like cAMP-binding protein
MVKATQQQDLSVLSSSRNGLVHLTANDWALIADKATRRQFKPGEYLVQQSRRTHGVFVILKGAATVQIPGQARTMDIGPGEVCGEISFIDELPATADVIARSETEAYYVDRLTLQSLFELFPHLGSRFYRSLASILSRRLRELIARQTGDLASSAKEAANSKKSTAK